MAGGGAGVAGGACAKAAQADAVEMPKAMKQRAEREVTGTTFRVWQKEPTAFGKTSPSQPFHTMREAFVESSGELMRGRRSIPT